MEKIILFYKFVPVLDPEMTSQWQRQLCTLHGLKGRVIVAGQGINATLGGPIEALKAYVREMNRSRDFKDIEYKWSEGSAEDFPRLSIKVRPELVTLAPDEEFDVFQPGKGLGPQEWHAYLQAHPDVLVLDARNDYESAVGRFESGRLVAPPIQAFRDIKPYLDSLPKDQPILTYCTGDVRCEYLSAYMRHKGFQEVYHLEGGIVKYGETFGDSGFWKGKCFVFDKRMTLAFSENSADLGVCVHCGTSTSHYVNCAELDCNKRLLVCDDCAAQFSTCPDCARAPRVLSLSSR